MLVVQSDDPGKTRCAVLDVRSSSSSWQPVASTAVARGGHAAVAVGEHSVVIVGGWDSDKLATDTAQLYDARADRWSERAEWRLPVPSWNQCAAVIE